MTTIQRVLKAACFCKICMQEAEKDIQKYSTFTSYLLTWLICFYSFFLQFWMGTHPNGPSTVLGKGKEIFLSEWIESNKDVLGEAVKEAFDSKLPFLLKVLSVNKALSIQAHPNKVHAAFLHRERPEIYKDPNHKPEMAIGKNEWIYENTVERPISDHLKCKDWVVAYGSWPLTRIEPQGASVVKRSRQIYFMWVYIHVVT